MDAGLVELVVLLSLLCGCHSTNVALNAARCSPGGALTCTPKAAEGHPGGPDRASCTDCFSSTADAETKSALVTYDPDWADAGTFSCPDGFTANGYYNAAVKPLTGKPCQASIQASILPSIFCLRGLCLRAQHGASASRGPRSTFTRKP